MEQINILILGETGVGKSTWVNAFRNYLAFKDLQEAMNAKDFPVLIPALFTFRNHRDGQETLVQVGKNDGIERLEEGESATKESRVHAFNLGKRIIRLIDTPGIGDTDGIDQDKINMENIVTCLSRYSKLHAICLFFKANNSRLTQRFRFCIQQLLVQLHISAKENILFCFTHARTTFFQPGDTLRILNKELNACNVKVQAEGNNSFYFDNESFRFLAGKKNGVPFEDEEITAFGKSWARSVKETKRLITYIRELKPHNLQRTIDIHEAWRVILAISRPMGEISKLINQNLVAAEDIAAKINEKDCDLDALQDILRFKAYDIEQQKLKYNRTVCTNQKCIRHVEVGQAKISHVVYETICHDECRIPGFLGSIIGSLTLYLCDAIGWDRDCRGCGHVYKEHMHIAYETILTEKEFFSPKVQREVQMLSDQKQQKELLLANINEEISASKSEQAIIIKASAKYAAFYKANALLPFNDSVVDFLHMTIRQERESPLRNESLLKNLEKTLKACEKESKALNRALEEAANENISIPANVNHLKNELFRLPLYGNKLREMFESVSIKNAVKREEMIAMTSELVASNDSKGATARLSDWLISLPTLTEKY